MIPTSSYQPTITDNDPVIMIRPNTPSTVLMQFNNGKPLAPPSNPPPMQQSWGLPPEYISRLLQLNEYDNNFIAEVLDHAAGVPGVEPSSSPPVFQHPQAAASYEAPPPSNFFSSGLSIHPTAQPVELAEFLWLEHALFDSLSRAPGSSIDFKSI